MDFYAGPTRFERESTPTKITPRSLSPTSHSATFYTSPREEGKGEREESNIDAGVKTHSVPLLLLLPASLLPSLPAMLTFVRFFPLPSAAIAEDK